MAEETDGYGEPLAPMGRYDALWRSVFLHGEYAIDINFYDSEECVDLYRDGLKVDRGELPMTFELEGGAQIEVETAFWGTKTARFTDYLGEQHEMRPAPGSGEYMRARLECERPLLGASIAAVSWSVLVIAVAVFVANAVHFFAKLFGIDLQFLEVPTWLGVSIAIAAAFAGIERALRLRHNPWLDS